MAFIQVICSMFFMLENGEEERKYEIFNRRKTGIVSILSKLFFADISLQHYILKEIIFEKISTDFDEAKAIIERDYKDNVTNNFCDKVYFFSELSKYLFDEEGNIVSLDEYTFFKLRLYATKCLDLMNEGENAIREERRKIERGEYSLGVKELVKSRFHDYEVIFYEDKKGIIGEYYYGEKIPDYILRFEGVVKHKNLIMNQRLTSVVYEELFEEERKFTYNILFGQRRIDSEDMLDISIEFKDVSIIANNLAKN
ncbi:hypothetical protein [Anaerosporobacter sp.]|uniref:hypothetical protein n=1 Tax=Anaerosporobacter sp. TaxID=1872529 RepID=UPI00286F1394|nr:hypothetical protein [Anaerosporobacter sp.]